MDKELQEADKPEVALEAPQIKELVKDAIREFHASAAARSEPVHKAELGEERKRREALERRVRELEEENRTTQRRAEEADRNAAVRAELQRLGVSKVDLAYKVVKDDVYRTDEGDLRARQGNQEFDLHEYLTQFVSANPEFLPARIQGGSGVGGRQEEPEFQASNVRVDLIRPGMNVDELQRIRQEVARLARDAMKGS